MPLSSRTRFGIRLVLAVAILAAVIIAARDERVGEALASLSRRAVLLATLAHIGGSIVIPAIVTYRTRGGRALGLSLWELIRINFGIRFYGMVLPSATATGVRWYRYQQSSSRSAAAALIVLEKLVQFFVYGALALVCIAVEMPRLGPDAVPFAVLLAVVTAACGSAVGAFFSDRLDPLLVPFAWITSIPWVGGMVRRIASAAVDYREHPARSLLSIAAWSTLGFWLFVTSGWVIVNDLGVGVPFLGLAWVRGVVFLATLLSLTVAGIGVREFGFVVLLGLYGVDDGLALGFALALLLIQIIIGAIGGAMELVNLARSPRVPSDKPGVEPAEELS